MFLKSPDLIFRKTLIKNLAHLVRNGIIIIWSFLICPRHPGKFGNTFRRPAAYRFHGPFYPSVVLTEPSFRRKSHYAVMDLRLNPEAVRLLQASFRSDLLIVLASTADVAPHHRFVPEECVFGCQGALLCFRRNNFVVTSHILGKKKPFAVGLAGLLSGLGRAILWMERCPLRTWIINCGSSQRAS